MSFEIKPLAQVPGTLLPIFQKFFKFDSVQSVQAVARVVDFLKDCQDDIYVGIEYPYVDKLYRNSYYHYWSSKFKHYHRDCIRLSFFKTTLTITDFYEDESAKKVKADFIGFLVLRPIAGRIIGRNILTPRFYKKSIDYYVAITSGHAAINGLKLNIWGFPHSSQDTEMMVCAETSLWSIMEYFSHRYPDYKSLLPRDIHKILAANSNFRQIPSDGLNIGQMSYVLKKIGFGVKRHIETEKEFFNMIKMYVESCIPIMAIVLNAKGIVHVMNIIGRTDFGKLGVFSVMENLKSGAVLYDYFEQPTEYLVVDDNLNPYRKISLTNPTSNYSDPRFAGCRIYATIIPLYPKVYIEADKAKTFIIDHIRNIDSVYPLDNYVVRIFLSSSRSYKDYIAKNKDLPPAIKALIISISMPKFIWIAELATPDLIEKHQCCGLVLMDATELIKAEILATLIKNLYIGILNDKAGAYSVTLPPFENFHNLKIF